MRSARPSILLVVLVPLSCASLLGCPADPTTPTATDPAAVSTTSEAAPTQSAIVVPPGAYPIPHPLPLIARPKTATCQPPQTAQAPIDFWLGGSGTADGQFTYPRALVTDPAGFLFVADKSGRIQKWTPDGKLLVVVRAPGIVQGKPTGLGLAANGDLLVADTHYCRVLVYSPGLELIRTYGAPGPKPGQFMMITGVVEAGGLHYTTDFGLDTARVQEFSPAGKLLRTYGTLGVGDGQFRRPMNLCVDTTRDRIYVADAVNHRVAVLDRKTLGWIETIGERGRDPGQLEFPYDVKLDEKGRLWIAEFGNQRISVVDPTTKRCLGTWGAPGRKVGGLNRPWAVALGPKNRVWALDSDRDRVYALTRAAWLGAGSG